MAHPAQADNSFLFPNLVQQLPAVMLITDLEGRILAWMGMAEALFGYNSHESHLLPIGMLFPADTRPETQSRLLDCLHAEGKFSARVGCQRKNGMPVSLVITARAVRDKAGKPLYFIVLMTEPTHAGGRLAKPLSGDNSGTELENAYTRLETVLHQLPVGLVIMDYRTEEVLFRNEAGATFWRGTEPIPSPTQVARTCIGIDSQGRRMRPEDWPMLRTFRTGETVQGEEFQLIKGPGEAAFVRVNSAAVHDHKGQTIAVALTFEDITRQKKIEQELHASEARFQQLTETIEEVFWLSDTNSHNLLYISPAYQRIWGRDSDSLLRDPSLFLEFVHPDDRERVGVKMEKQRREQTDLEYRIVRPDGSIRWVLDRAFPIRDPQGKLVRVAGVAADITDRKRAEEMLRRSERLATAGRMAATIAHEINNPLEAVTNLLYLLARDSSLGPAAREYATMAQQEIARVAQVARQTLAFYRESAMPAWLDVSQLLQSVLALYSPRVESRGIRITKALHSSRLVHGMAGELRQVFSNLLVNALDATPQGGSIQVRIRDGYDHRRSLMGVRVLIADTGTGVEASLRRKIFEPFFTTKEDGGTGLGLWVVQAILNKRGATIHMRSSTRPGRTGTCFSVFLPLEMSGKAL